MITQDYINGYVNALDNIHDMLNATMDDAEKMFNNQQIETQEYVMMVSAYTSVQQYIADVKNNYKKMIKEINEKLAKGN